MRLNWNEFRTFRLPKIWKSYTDDANIDSALENLDKAAVIDTNKAVNLDAPAARNAGLGNQSAGLLEDRLLNPERNELMAALRDMEATDPVKDLLDDAQTPQNLTR